MNRLRRLGACALPALLVGIVLGCGSASAQVGKRVALIVGDGDYRQIGSLPDADRDASLLADALVRLDFEVIRAHADVRAMRSALDGFERSAPGAEAALFFYAGHAVRLRNQTRLVPVDAALQDLQGLERETLPLAPLVDAMSQAGSAFLLADTCVDAQLAARLQWISGASAGLGDPPSRGGLLSAFATAQEQACGDRLFVETLLADLEEPGLDAKDLMQRTRQWVARRSGGAQQVALTAQLPRPFSFADDKVALTGFRRLGADPAADRMRGYAEKHPAHALTPIVKVLLTEREAEEGRPGGAASARAWGGLMNDGWNSARSQRAQASREQALEARWSRENEASLPERKQMHLAAMAPLPPLASPTPAPRREPPPEPAPAPAIVPPAAAIRPPADVPPTPEAKKPPPPDPKPERKLEEALAPVPDAPPPPSFPPPPPTPAEEPKVASLAAPHVIESETAEKKSTEPPPQDTAALAPPAPAEPPPPPFNPNSPEVMKAAQLELKRLGCYAGDVDGQSGPQTLRALGLAAGKLGMSLQPLTEAALAALKGYNKGLLCPPEPVVPPPRPAPPSPPVATRAVPPPAAPVPVPDPTPAYTPPPAPVVQQPAPVVPPAAAVTPAPAPTPPPKKKFNGITM